MSKKPETKEEPRILRTETRPLATKLTDAELRQKGDELATTVQGVAAEEDRQKNLKDQMKAQLSELTARMSRLSLIVSRREELRDVEVNIVANPDGTVTEVRNDTGEIILTRVPRDYERQPKLLTPDKEAPNA